MDEANQSVFNFDIAELIMIFEIKAECINNLNSWNLEASFWSLRKFRREADALFARKHFKRVYILEEDKAMQEEKEKNEKRKTEKVEIDEDLKAIEFERMIYNRQRKPTFEMTERYFLMLEAFYMKISLILKTHGIYFREGRDNQLAVLNR